MRKISNTSASRNQNKNTTKQKLDVKKNTNKVDVKENKVSIIASFKVHKESGLLAFLYEKITNESRNNIKKYLSNQQVLVNGTMTTQFDFPLVKEDLVQISKNKINKNFKVEMKLDIIYEDDEIIAINKPSGLLSIESDKEKASTAYSLLTEYVRKKDKKARIYIVHRIDKDTSGVLIVAKNEQIRNLLQHHWQDIVLKREYIAICEGKFKEKEGTIKNYLHENVNHIMYSSSVAKNGQYSITHYKVIKENDNYSMVDVCIDTGRKNQIRVHMSDLNHKVVGDKKYGPVSDPINRLGLHAYVLEFIHPVSKKNIKFKAKVPPVFETLFKAKKNNL